MDEVQAGEAAEGVACVRLAFLWSAPEASVQILAPHQPPGDLVLKKARWLREMGIGPPRAWVSFRFRFQNQPKEGLPC